MRSDGRSTTLMAVDSYWDEDGREHYHDRNVTTTGYFCSRGHRWATKTSPVCPTCGPAPRD